MNKPNLVLEVIVFSYVSDNTNIRLLAMINEKCKPYP